MPRWTPIIALALLTLPAAAHAQQSAESDTSQLIMVRYDLAMARLAVDFWTPRLNAYKIEVDRILSASDLVDVNELRTRAALLFERIRLAEQKEREREAKASDSAEGAERIPTLTEAQIDSVMAIRMAREIRPTDSAEAVQWMRERKESEQRWEREWERDKEEKKKESLRSLELVLAGNDEAITPTHDKSSSRSNERRDAYSMHEEVNEIRYVTGWIARSYRPEIDALMARVFTDLKEFYGASRERTRAFFDKNRAAILEDEWEADRILSNLRSLKQMQSLQNRDGITERMINGMLEAFLILYNGQDLREIMMIDGMPLASGYAAEGLDAGTSLGQNIPNPASTRTTIPYTLSEPGTHVILQLLDTRGAVAATFDQGSREAGDHSATIDVTTLPPGSYLYQLKITTPGGERISSRGMQVVR